MKFDTIQGNAKRLYADALDNWSGLNRRTDALNKGTEALFTTLMPFVRAAEPERQELRDFAQTFGRHEKDWLANAANGNGFHAAVSQVALRAREAGLELIDRWDVRQVGRLIELFPDAVPAKLRNRPLKAYQEDSDDCPWMVEPA